MYARTTHALAQFMALKKYFSIHFFLNKMLINSIIIPLCDNFREWARVISTHSALRDLMFDIK